VRCPRCGNENADTNRFCGMCGASLISAPTPSSGSSKDAMAPAPTSQGGRTAAQGSNPTSTASAVASVAPRAIDVSSQHSRPEPGITGPSFLGLNTPPGQTDTPRTTRARGAHDELQTSHSVDYLLEEEQEPRRGWGKVLLVLVALGLALGFGYLHWKQGGFDWVTGARKPQATSPDSSSATSTSAASPVAPAQAQPTAPSNASSDQSLPSTPAAGTASAGSNPSPSNSSPAPSTPPAAVPQTNAPQAAASSAVENPAPTTKSQDSTPPAPIQKPAANSEDAQTNSSDSESQPATKAAPAPRPKPSKPPAAVPVSIVAEGERYIYGRGVAQDCDHGLRLLKRAGEYDPKAMAAMGSLYSTGTCAPRDLPTAYRWYAQALHRDPDNQTLQSDLQKLWSQMTQPERQLAIRLSQ
jgi:hypothetical protein